MFGNCWESPFFVSMEIWGPHVCWKKKLENTGISSDFLTEVLVECFIVRFFKACGVSRGVKFSLVILRKGWTTPLKFKGLVHLKITPWKKKNIFQTFSFGFNMLVFRGVIVFVNKQRDEQRAWHCHDKFFQLSLQC